MSRASPTLASYFGRRFLETLAAALLAVMAIIMIVNLIELTKRAGDNDLGFATLAMMAALQTPQIALKAAPFVVLLATLACFARLARASELVVGRGAGLSVWTLASAPVIAAAAFGALSFSALNPMAAATAQRFEIMENRYLEGESERFSVSAEGLWLRQPGPRSGVDIIEARAADGALTRLITVTVYRFDADGGLSERIDAVEARLHPGAWELRDGRRRSLRENAADLAGVTFARLELPTDLTSERILESFSPPEQISFWRLPGFIRALEQAGFSAQRLRAYWHSELSAPLLFAAMAAIGAGFAQRHPRLGGLGLAALGAALSGFGLFFLTDVAKALGASGAIPAALSAWAPAGAAALFAATLLLWRDER